MIKMLKNYLFKGIRNTMSADVGLLLMRVGISVVMFSQHGFGKLMSYSQQSSEFPDPLGVGTPVSLALVVTAEFFAAIALAFGFLTRLAVIPLIINMSVIFFVIHTADPFATKELAFIFLIAFIGFIVAGPGRFSVDYLLSKWCDRRCK